MKLTTKGPTTTKMADTPASEQDSGEKSLTADRLKSFSNFQI